MFHYCCRFCDVNMLKTIEPVPVTQIYKKWKSPVSTLGKEMPFISPPALHMAFLTLFTQQGGGLDHERDCV